LLDQPDVNLNFGSGITDEVRRRFILPLWNSYAFFATYARLDGFDPRSTPPVPLASAPSSTAGSSPASTN
jgi:isoleucyl-tRNA synthetase